MNILNCYWLPCISSTSPPLWVVELKWFLTPEWALVSLYLTFLIIVLSMKVLFQVLWGLTLCMWRLVFKDSRGPCIYFVTFSLQSSSFLIVYLVNSWPLTSPNSDHYLFNSVKPMSYVQNLTPCAAVLKFSVGRNMVGSFAYFLSESTVLHYFL